MKKTNYILMMLFVALLHIAGSQRLNAAEATIWDGNDLPVTLKAGDSQTFSYVLIATLYVPNWYEWMQMLDARVRKGRKGGQENKLP